MTLELVKRKLLLLNYNISYFDDFICFSDVTRPLIRSPHPTWGDMQLGLVKTGPGSSFICTQLHHYTEATIVEGKL